MYFLVSNMVDHSISIDNYTKSSVNMFPPLEVSEYKHAYVNWSIH